MKTILLSGIAAENAPTAIALGMFDGVHLGHRRIITAAKNKSTELSVSTSVLIFSSSPHGSSELLSLEDRLSKFKGIGIDTAFVYDFEELRDLSPEEFVRDILHRRHNARAVTAGYNYRFGKFGAGDSDALCKLAAECGIDTCICERVEALGDSVSSTRIRELLANGDIESANILLTYPYYFTAPVLHGKELGRTLGLPTINQEMPRSRAKMARGIYYTKTVIDGQKYISVSNIGVRPTVENSDRVNIETHILDFDSDLYGRTVTVEFYGRGRGEMRFDGVESLRREIELDCARARAYFNNSEKE